ncbi:MAG: IS110 family transposase [Albidovulum sp.]|uniref:IS110 family transposase n=1 Tax=Albidovulum sp. TaxID=1872424 RepID=UPI003CB57EC3
MENISIIGLDLAKSVFQVHGAAADGSVVLRKKLTRSRVLSFFGGLPKCVVAMEACASSHYWAREIGRLGHEVRLIAPVYVKPFVKRNKNDAADAEAIVEAALRPTMRFVAPKSEEQQAAGMAFKTRDLFVRQRTQTINALRGHLAEYGVIAPKGKAHLGQLVSVIRDPDSGLPASVAELGRMLIERIEELGARIDELSEEVRNRARSDDTVSRLLTIPGIGPICAAAMVALAPPAQTFSKGRDFAAWLGLTPRQHSSGGKERLGRTSKMGQRDLRRLLVSGAMAMVYWTRRNGAPAGSWLARMIARKPAMLVAVALANRIARVAWALMARGGVYRAPEPAA